MRRTSFQFKQFTIEQDRCAMKVCTDSCLFGALIETKNAKRILDIGSGTGLLSLMCAQKSDALIDAIEIEQSAAQQCDENFKDSPWKNQLQVYPVSIQEFTKKSPEYFYDLIISNPPFYSDSLHSPNTEKNVAHHSASLSLQELLECVLKLLTRDGNFWILLPEYEAEIFKEQTLLAGLYLTEKINIRNLSGTKTLRQVQCWKRENFPTEERIITIRKNEKEYTEEFVALLKDYYLYL